MKKYETLVYSAVGLAALFLILMAFNYLAGINPLRADLTQGKLYTLSDGTRKLLLRLADGEEIETVIIPSDARVTLCISSQAGCAMACQFCATARMGLHRNLSAAEIVGQILAARRALDAGEDFVGVLGPGERDGVVVPVAGERADGGGELFD